MNRPWRRAGWLLCVLSLQAAAQGATSEASPAPGAPADLLSVCSDALQFNSNYESARAQFYAAKDLLPLAKGKLLPQLGLGAQLNWTHEDADIHYDNTFQTDSDGTVVGTIFSQQLNSVLSTFHARVDDTFLRTVFGVQLSQALYRRDLFLGLDKAQVQQQQAAFGLDAAQEELLISVVEAYFTLLAARDGQSFAQAETRTLREQLDYIQTRAGAGLATDADVKAAQAAYELAQADEAAADNALVAAQVSLEAVAGKTYANGFKVLPSTVTLSPPQPQDESLWVQRARDENPGVLAKRAAVEIARVDRRVAQAGRLPKFDVAGTAYSLDNGGGISGDRNQQDYQIGITMTVPIYTGGQIGAAIHGAQEMEKKAEADAEAATAKAVRDTRIAYLNSSAGLQRVTALKRAVEAAIDAEASARAGYDAGTLTNADVLDAIDRRYQAETNYAAARYKFLVNTLKLKQLAGNLLTADLAQINRLLRDPEQAPAPTEH
ncbi:TolC family protein [Solimonas soli]|uniref:TolC family protein n=1 Tax=Solimonas soli TaxID=413479 RepID=UPI000488BB72|nr:TolC family protein [Solimonas soli]